MSVQEKETEEDLRSQLLEAYYDDPILACREVLPEWFPTPMPWVHRGILAIILQRADFLLNFGEEVWPEGAGRWTKKKLSKIVRNFVYLVDPDDPSKGTKPIFIIRYGEDGRTPVAIDMALGQFTNILMPRESAKTTITNAGVLLLILYQLVGYFLYISNTGTHADDQLATIKRELETNDQIHLVWGNLVPDRVAPQSWTYNEIETTTGVLGASKGRGAQIRGMNRFSKRPDLIIMDDIEDEESVGTDEQLDKTQKWYMKAVEPALTKVKGRGRLINLGTPQHPKDISYAHARDPRFTTVRFGAVDPDGDMLWPLYMSKQKYEALKRAYTRRGQLFEFGMEYDCEINGEAQSKFKAEHIQRYKLLEPEEFTRDFLVRAVCIDPAISAKKGACPSALAVVGLSERGFWHVADYYQKIGMTPREQVDKYFELSMKWMCNRHGVESVAYQAALVHLLREEMFRKRHYFEINELLPGSDKRKHERIEGIVQPRTSASLVTFNQRWVDLELQFLQWPHGGMDGPDVIAMCMAQCDPYAGLSLPVEVDEEGKEITPDILRERTMEDLDWDEKMGCP